MKRARIWERGIERRRVLWRKTVSFLSIDIRDKLTGTRGWGVETGRRRVKHDETSNACQRLTEHPGNRWVM